MFVETFQLAVVAAFLTLSLAEALWLIVHRHERYAWQEATVSIAVAVGRRLATLAAAPLIGAAYALAWEHRLHTFPLIAQPWALLPLFLGIEFVYYWYHRWSHEVRWMWATHRTHHSSPVLHLPAAVRLGWTGLLSGGWLLYTPLVLLGFHPLAVLALIAANLIYQFWLHTETIPKLGPLEWVLNTPSHHRVHHAVNPRYLDRNYGGVLIVFDRLFGSFAAEDTSEPCRYGLVGKVAGRNPLMLAFEEWWGIARDVAAAPDWRARLALAFGPPGWSRDGSRRTARQIRAEAGVD